MASGDGYVHTSLDAHTHIWDYIFHLSRAMCLKCAVDLRIPDAIHKNGGQPMTLSQLVLEIGLSPDKAGALRRLMHLLSLSGFFTVHDSDGNHGTDEAYLLTNYSTYLLQDNTNSFSLAPVVSGIIQPRFVSSWLSLGEWFRTPNCPTPFHLITGGESVWEAASKSPELNSSYNEVMASDSRLFMDAVIKEHGEVFKELKSLIDVGGGNGYTALALAKAFPHLKCSVLELPHVVAAAPKSNAEVVGFIGGNMLEHIPPTDAILIKTVLHNWSDENCVRILKNCKKAIPPKDEGGKLIILDIVMSSDLPHKISETQRCFDLAVLVINDGGRQRTEGDWKRLLKEAGFTGCKITPGLGLRAIIESYY